MAISFYDERGAVTGRQKMKLVTWGDLLGIGEHRLYHFEHEVFWLISTETTWTASIKERRFQEGSTYNDFYGLGTSIDEPVQDAAKFLSEYLDDRFDVQVFTTLKKRPSIWAPPDQEIFYDKAVRCTSVPLRWFPDTGNISAFGDIKWETMLRPERTTWEIWKNGEFTPLHACLTRVLDWYRENDEAGEKRKDKYRPHPTDKGGA